MEIKKIVPGTVQLFQPTQLFKMSKNDIARLRSFRLSVGKKLRKKFYDLPNNFIEKRLSWMVAVYWTRFDLWWNPSLKKTLYGKDQHNYLYTFFKNCLKWRRYWFDPDLIDWKDNAYQVIRFLVFEEWNDLYWDRIDFNDPENLRVLVVENSSKDFPIWWSKLTDSQKTIIRIKHAKSLIGYHPKYCKVWFNDEINIENNLRDLALYCHNDFDLWWDRSKIKNTIKIYNASKYFVDYLGNQFEEWFDKEIFDYRKNSDILCTKFPDKFDIWWDKRRFNYMQNVAYNMRYDLDDGQHCNLARFLLIRYCSNEFRTWWDRLHFRPNNTVFKLLSTHCEKYKEFWGSDYIVHTLTTEGSVNHE